MQGVKRSVFEIRLGNQGESVVGWGEACSILVKWNEVHWRV